MRKFLVSRFAAIWLGLFVVVPALAEHPIAIEDKLRLNSAGFGRVKLLANDLGLADKPITLTISRPPAFGTVEIEKGNVAKYHVTDDFPGLDTFEYTITDKDGESHEAVVKVRGADLFDRLSELGFSLQRASTGKNMTNPASFSLLATLDDDTVFASDFFLAWKPVMDGPWELVGFELEPLVSVEGKVASNESEAENAWKFRAGMNWGRNFNEDRNRVDITTQAKFESDRDFDTQKIVFEVEMAPTLPFLAIGEARPMPILDKQTGKAVDHHWAQVIWQPYVGGDFGYTVDDDATEETKDTVVRLTTRVRFEVLLNAVAEFANLTKTILYVEDQFYYLPIESGDNIYNLVVSGVDLGLTKNLSIGVQYKRGRAAPTFGKVETIGGVIGVKF